ncbi:hypothetical protein CA3LBN_003317 [Candidozyma haemuli]|uniref:RING-type domain-containing protein n=1 Tax=Candidozyma haemuli TaxID=45357 RepID=A0ABX8I7A8_9ASCO|nr:hypothetical protein CA3LBN_003317 [[Candida] haemuloni]
MPNINASRKKVLGTLGAALALYHKNYGDAHGLGGRVTDLVNMGYSFKFKFTHFVVLAALVFANFVKWAIFGKLTANEVKILKNKAGYTAWEFFFGLLVFYNTSPSFFDIQREVLKYALLFFCVLLVKYFHYLTADRVHTLYYSPQAIRAAFNGKHVHLRLAVGLLLILLVEGLLIFQYFQDIIMKNHSSENVLVTIFGFEIMNQSPLTVVTLLQFILDSIESKKAYSNYTAFKERKLRLMFVAEFILNVLRFGMSCIFTLIFMYYYTFPVHTIPSSYDSLKVAVIKTRNLVNFRKKELMIQRLQNPTSETLEQKCIICYEELSVPTSDTIKRVQPCGHGFHLGCLLQWIDFSPSCPVCRKRI